MSLVEETWLESTLLDLARTRTSVPEGQFELQPGDPVLRAAIDEVILPLVEGLQPDELRQHPAGDLAARFGPDRGDGLLLQTYLVSQHGDPAHTAEDSAIETLLVDGRETRVLVAPGARQNKGAMAAVLDAVRRRPERLTRPVWLAVNTEGRSSHGGSMRVIDELGVRAASGVVAISTGGRVSLGNRGRVDLLITIPGRSSHSSQPELGINPIERAADVIRALRDAPLPPDDAHLGHAAHTAYRLEPRPIAPHSIPAEVELTVDRRLLPGETPGGAAAALRAYLATALPFEVRVAESVSMLPALVSPDAPVAAAFAHRLGPDGLMYSRNTFDAGYACSRGIPTVMFGPGTRDFGDGITSAESVALDDCVRAAEVLRTVIEELCS